MDKQDILDYVMNEVEAVKNGEKSALDVYPKLNELKKSIDELRKEIYDHVIDEADKYDKREDIIRDGYKISIVSRTYYKYDHSPKYQMIDQKRKNLQSLMKKAAKADQELYDEETGELIPPAKTSQSMYPKCEFVGNQL